MRRPILLLCALSLVLGAFAQKRSGQVLSAEAFSLREGWQEGPVLDFADSLKNYGFLALSAYSFDTLQEAQMQWRFRSEGGLWSEWQALAPPHEGQIQGRQVWVAEALQRPLDQWQVRLSQSLKADLQLRLFLAPASKEKTKAQSVAPSTSESCQCPPPPLCDRGCWCPDGSCLSPPSPPTSVTHLIVHHSAGFSNYPDYRWVVSYYWDLHVNTNGWSDIGYNWLIDPNGQVYQGRGSGVLGAHFSCLNGGTAGICIIGNYMNGRPSDSSLQSLIQLASWEACQHQIRPADSSLHSSSQLQLRHLSGHRDANSATVGCPSGTVCPGNQLYPLLDSLALVVNGQPCLLDQKVFYTAPPSLYPQPAQGLVQVRWSQAARRQLTLYDLQGRPLRRWQSGGQSAEVQREELPAGYYRLEVKSKNEYSQSPLIWH